MLCSKVHNSIFILSLLDQVAQICLNFSPVKDIGPFHQIRNSLMNKMIFQRFSGMIVQHANFLGLQLLLSNRIYAACTTKSPALSLTIHCMKLYFFGM